MAELGTWLRETREAQDLSLEEVEAQTRIRRTFLQALEEGDYNVLPGEVYVRGFLRNYALYLGLDPEEARRRYGQEALSQGLQQPTQGGSEFRPIDAALEPPSRLVSRLVMRIALILLLLVGATGVGAWYWYGHPLPQPPAWWPPRLDVLSLTTTPLQSLPTSMPPVPTSTPTPTLLPPPTPTPTPTETPSPTSTPTLPPPPTPTMTPTPKAVATSAVLPLPTPTPLPTATPTPTSIPTPLPAPPEVQGIQLKAQVIERTWVLVTVDGEVDFQGILEGGEERTWWAEHRMGFRCGNAGGVLLTINGEELGALGERGQVVDQTWVVQEEQIATATPFSP